MISVLKMCGSYRKKVLPILSELTWWQVFSIHDCFCCNFPIAAPDPQYIHQKEIAIGNENSTSDNKDSALDAFTEKIILEKCNKWKNFQSKTRSVIHVQQTLHQKADLINNPNIETCTNEKQIISDDEILTFLHGFQRSKLFSEINQDSFRQQDSSIESINCDGNSSPEEYEKQEKCIYLAYQTWKKEHFEDALNLFWNAYTQYIPHEKVKYVLLALMANTIPRKGESVLVLSLNFSKKVVDAYSDYTFLSYLWEYCFLSEWYSDNEIALSLLEEYSELKKFLQMRVHHITKLCLLTHKVEVTQRFFEILLKYEMKSECELVLRSLFDYACFMKDLYACSAIVQSCHDLDVTLTEDQKARFVHLFSKHDTIDIIKQNMKTWTTKPSNFKFKF